MIIVMKPGATSAQEVSVVARINECGLSTKTIQGEGQNTISITEKEFDRTMVENKITGMDGVEKVIPISVSYKLASVHFEDRHTIQVERNGTRVIFNGNMVMMAGPCAIESEEQMMEVSKFLSDSGVKILRGGAYKPRTRPTDFRGLGEEGLRIGRKASDKYGMLFVTEAMTPEHVPLVAKYADIIQIGTRNMQNFSLLEAAGSTNMPVLLKRGMSATLDELLNAACYVLEQQEKPQVIPCLRGIRTFEDHTRNTPELGALLSLREKTWLPVIFDPSHSSGKRNHVGPLACAAAALGYNGLMIETHPDPAAAKCDGKQSLPLDEFARVNEQINFFRQTYDEVNTRNFEPLSRAAV